MSRNADVLRTPGCRVLLAPAGSGKTEVLHALARRGEQVVDLEALAVHRGSAFGALAAGQPSHRTFQQRLRRAFAGADPGRILWLEHEARSLGRVGLPPDLLGRWAGSDGVSLEVPQPRRLARILADYAPLGLERLLAATARIAPRLGPSRTERVCASLRSGQLADAAAVLLAYYDDAYADQLRRRPGRTIMTLAAADGASADELAAELCRRIAV